MNTYVIYLNGCAPYENLYEEHFSIYPNHYFRLFSTVRRFKILAVRQSGRLEMYNVLYLDLIKNQHERLTNILNDDTFSNANVKAQIQGLHNKTLATINRLDSLKEEIIELNGGRSSYDETYNNSNRRLPFEEIFIDNNKGNEIKQTIDSYTDYISTLEITSHPLSVDTKTNPWMKFDPNFKDVDFTELHFDKCDIFQVIEAIRYYQIKVLFEESYALTEILTN